MPSGDGYSEQLKGEFGEMIDQLDLSETRKRYLRSRWLDQVLWMESAAARAQRRYYRLRLTTIVGGVTIPALVSLSVREDLAVGVDWATFALSLMVALSAAVEEFFRFGERWRHYRRSVEELKMEGWQYFQLSGHYGQGETSHEAAHASFASRVEAILMRDVGTFVTSIATEKEKRGASQDA